MKVTQEQIDGWKKKHKDIFQVTAEDGSASCIMRKPTRQELNYATKISQKNPGAFNDYIVRTIWIEGDEVMRTDDGYFLGLCAKIEEILEIKDAELKKL